MRSNFPFVCNSEAVVTASGESLAEESLTVDALPTVSQIPDSSR
jgi:hypothetical protein